MQGDLRFFCHRLQRLHHRFAQVIQLNRFQALRLFDFFLNARQADNIVDQRNQAQGFFMNAAGELANIIHARNHAVLHHLRIAGNRRQRRFQLMRNIGGKLLSAALCHALLGLIQYDHHSAVYFTQTQRRAGIDMIHTPVHRKIIVEACTGQCCCHTIVQLLGAVDNQIIFSDKFTRICHPSRQHMNGTRVDGHNVFIL